MEGLSMLKINYLAVLVAAIVALVVGAVWYSPLLFGKTYMELRGIDSSSAANMMPTAVELIGEFVRYLVVAFVLAYLLVRLGIGDWKDAVLVGLWVGLGIQAMMLLGAVLHEKMPWLLYAIHAGDAVVKSLMMTLILGVWRK